MSAPAIASAGCEPLLAKVSPMVRTLSPGANRARLRLPVAHHTGGRNDQEGGRPGVRPRSGSCLGASAAGPGRSVLRRADQRQGLHGLAQAHVVGQHAAEAVPVQEAQPVEALQLVRAQLGVQASRAGAGP